MMPRYVRVVDELPKTPTQKVQKHLLRKRRDGRHLGPRDQAGIRAWIAISPLAPGRFSTTIV
jgi:crotonobetaine/carnitine-CoA ligase